MHDREIALVTGAGSGLGSQVADECLRPIALTQAMLPLLRKSPAARVIDAGSSGSSLARNADRGNAERSMFGIYPVTKAAQRAAALGFTVALEPSGISVNVKDSATTGAFSNDAGDIPG